jgi:hypothetical protein
VRQSLSAVPGVLIGLGLCLAMMPAQAATLTLCNKSDERLVVLHAPGKPGAPLGTGKWEIARSTCAAWNDAAPGAYNLSYMLGESTDPLLCELPVEFAESAVIEITKDTPANCIR